MNEQRARLALLAKSKMAQQSGGLNFQGQKHKI
jgi:hypothetical protein